MGRVRAGMGAGIATSRAAAAPATGELPSNRHRWRTWLLGCAAVVVGTLLSLWRQPGAGALDTVWAEDGSVFLSDAVRLGPLDAITGSYAGYYHLIPRLLAETVALAPLEVAATLLAVEAAVCTALVAVLVYVASADHLPDRLSRGLAAAVVILVPVAHGDLPNSIANVHWAGLYALFWMLMWRPRSRAERIVAVVVVFLVAASDILTVVFVPLALALALTRSRASARRPDRHGVVLAGALGFGVALQLLGLFIGSGSRLLHPDPLLAMTGYVVRAVPPAVLGEQWLGPEVDGGWLALAGLAWLLVTGALCAALTRVSRPIWPLAGLAAVHGMALYVVPVLLSGVATPRYAAAPAMLLTTALVALLRPDAGPRGRLPRWALVALLAVVFAVNLRSDNARAHGPRWSGELDRARQTCTEVTADMAIVIPPRYGPGWQVRLPCDRVRPGP